MPALSTPLLNRTRRLALTALDLALPPRCIGCGERVDANGLACAACWSRLTFIAPPVCDCCGAPFDFAVEGVRRCAACYANPPAYDRARAAVLYDEGSRGLILGFKHGDRLHADLIVPVPLHRWRLVRRRYNQAALIAAHAAKRSGVTHIPDLLIRHRATP